MGEEYYGYMDQGSSHNFLTEAMAKKFRSLGVKINPIKTKIDFMVGDVITDGFMTINMKWCTGSRRTPFCVVPGSKIFILGQEFMNAEHITPSVFGGYWYQEDSPGERIPFDSREDGRCYNMSSSEYAATACSDMEGPAPSCFRVQALVEEYHQKGLFSDKPGVVKILEHEIDLIEGEIPVKYKPRPVTKEKREIMDEIIGNLLDDDVIEPCESRWGCCPVLVKKKVKPGAAPNYRMCIDYRPLNKKTLTIPYSSARIDYIFAQLGQAQVFTTLDACQGYHQIRMKKEHRGRTAFVTPHRGSFHYKRLPFGLSGAGFTFQRVIDKVMEGAAYNHVMAFLDDIVIYSPDWESHVLHLRDVFERLRAAGFTINPTKVHIGRKKIPLLGHIIEPGKVSPDPEKVRAVNEYPAPRNPKEIQRFLGFIGFYRAYIVGFSKKAAPLTLLLRQDELWQWGEQQQRGFNDLREAMTSDSCLALPDMAKPFTIQCDACLEGLGAVLVQDGEKGPRPVAFASRLLLPAEKGYCITELEALSVVWAVNKFRQYVEHAHFVVETDHAALRTMLTIEEPSGRIRRWAMRLMGLDCTITYRRGTCNLSADALSRAPCGADEPCHPRLVDEMLPIQDPLITPKLKFAEGNQGCGSSHSCRRCCPEVENKPPHMPRGPRIPRSAEAEQALFSGTAEPNQMPTTIEEWLRVQEGDEEISCILDQVEEGDNTIIKQGYKVSPEGLLLRATPSGNVVVVPRDTRSAVLKVFHDHITSAHLGVKKTLVKIKQEFTWKTLSKDVQDYVRGCDICQKIKPKNMGAYGMMDSQIPNMKGRSLSCDLIGPLPKTYRRHEYALVIVDDFTRNLEIYPLVRATAPAIADKLVDYCLRYGFPKYIRSDNGSQFTSNVWDEVCRSLLIKPRRTVTYRPQGNPTERSNKTIKQCIKTYAESHHSWDKYLSAVAFAIRTSPNDTTGYSPALLTFGEELRSPFAMHPEPSVDVVSPSSEEYADLLRTRISEAVSSAQQNCADARKRYQKYYNRGRLPPPFSIGDEVLRKTHVLSDAAKGVARSLAASFEGPFILHKKISENVYVLSDQEGNNVGVCNVDQLKLYHYAPEWAEMTSDTFEPAQPSSAAEINSEDDDLEEDNFVDASNIAVASITNLPATPPVLSNRPIRIRQAPVRYGDITH